MTPNLLYASVGTPMVSFGIRIKIPGVGVRREVSSIGHHHLRQTARILLSAVLASGLLHGSVLADTATNAATIEVMVQEGRLTANFSHAALADVLRAIGQETGIRILLSGDIDKPITRSFSEAPLESAVRDLVGNAALIMIYDPVQVGEHWRNLREIWVYGGLEAGVAPRSYVARVGSGTSSTTNKASKLQEDSKNGLANWSFEDLAGLNRARRIQEVKILGSVGSSQAIEALTEILTKDEDPAVRSQAISVLKEIDGEPVVEALEAGLGDDAPWIRTQVVHALGAVGGARAVRGLGQVLFGDPDPEIRHAAVENLATQPSEPAQAFLEAATQDPDEMIRQTAAAILAGYR